MVFNSFRKVGLDLFEEDDMNRTLCDVLNEMRKAHETSNYSYLLGLIEEAQSMGNRMEAGLGDKNDINWRTERVKDLKEEYRKLNKEKKKLEEEVDKLKGDG